MALSTKTKKRLEVAMARRAEATEIQQKIDQASHVIVAVSTSATISTDTAFAAALQVGDLVLSHKAAANQQAVVATAGTLPGGITDAAGVTMALRAAL